MSKVLLVLDAVSFHPFPRTLRMLGIDYEIAYFTGDLQTLHGQFAWNNDTAIRAYLRQYRAVLVGARGNRMNLTPAILRSFRWLGWNDPDDPPVAYLGVDPRAGYADIGTLPSDFPVIRPDSSNPTDTLFPFTTAYYSRTAGLRVRLHREGVELYTNTAIAQATTHFALNDGYLYRLDLAKHAALGGQGEILASPVSEDLTFPSDTVCAYRYKNRYLLPQTASIIDIQREDTFAGMFWALYALKLLDVPVSYPIPLFMAMDDALMLYFAPSGNPAGLPTYAQFARIGEETYRYWAEAFYPRTGCAMICGLLTGGRYRAGYAEHWKLVHLQQRHNGTIDSETHAAILRWHQLLLRHHYGGLPCTIHDHTLEVRANRTHTNFVRHSDAGYPHAAPNDVPITRGTTRVKASALVGAPPNDARERLVDGETYYEWGFTTSGTGATLSSITPNNPYAARLVWETAVAEMRTYGFPDAHGGNDYRLMISPNNFVGDVATWRVIRELGYQALRCHPPRSVHSLPDTNPAPWHRIFDGLHLLSSRAGLDPASIFEITMGLYYPSYETRTASGKWGLDLSGDISTLWNTDRPTAGRRAYRRAIAAATEAWLTMARGATAPMAHPNVIIGWADPANPTRPIDFDDPDLRINFLLELAWNMEQVVRVLYPYLKWGTVQEYVAARERVMG